jgi:hypothetical protein
MYILVMLMRKQLALPAFLAFLILAASPVLALEPLEISVTPESQTIKPGSSAQFTLTITNQRSVINQYRIDLYGDEVNWYVPEYIVKSVAGTGTQNLNLVFFPTEWKEGAHDYEVSVESLKFPEDSKSASFSIIVPYPVSIESFSYTSADSQLRLRAELVSDRSRSADVVFELLDEDGTAVDSVGIPAVVSGSRTVTSTLSLPEMLLAGEYEVVARLGGTGVRVSEPMVIEPVRRVVQVIDENDDFFSKEVVTHVTNEGNVVEKDFVIHQVFSVDPVTGYVTLTDNCLDQDGNRICKYTIGEIQPGATAEISYRISYLPTYGLYAVLAALIAGMVVLSYARVTSPRIRKRHLKKGEEQHNIILQLRNPYNKQMKNVIVRDWVSPLAKVLQDDIHGVKPMVRRSEAGTELIWRLGNMRPKEERFLSYGIRTLVQGSLKMPRAYARFNDDRDRKSRIYSESVLIE